MARKRVVRPVVVDSDGSENDKMHANDQENVHEDAGAAVTVAFTTTQQAAARAAAISRVTPSPVLESKQAIARDTPPLPAVWNYSIHSPPSATAVVPNGYNAVGGHVASPTNALLVPAEASLLTLPSAFSAFDNRALAFSHAQDALSQVQAAEGTLRLPRTLADFDDRAQAFAQGEAALSQAQDAAAGVGDEDEVPKEIADAEAKRILDAEEKQDWKKTQKELDDLFEQQSKEKFAGIPDFEMPSGFQDHLRFFDYQQDGIRWLVHQETNENRQGPFWKVCFSVCGLHYYR
jgi:hypothetical protein